MKGTEDVFDAKVWALLSKQPLSCEEANEAARILYEHFIPKIMGVLHKAGSDVISAEDITKEAIDRAIKTYRKGQAKFLTYVTRIALNIQYDRYRKGLVPEHGLQPLEDVKQSDENLSVSDPPFELEDGRVEKSKMIRMIELVFRKLSEEYQVLIRFDIQDVPKEFYMELYGINDTLYRQRKRRAYNKLRSLLSDKE
jgi:DNA-directed RNA polymerase specialized sigma24 family protein